MSWTQGGGPAGVKRDQSHRRLDAGEAEHGGSARDSPSGDHLDGGLVLRVAGELAHLMEATGGHGDGGARRNGACGGSGVLAAVKTALQRTAGVTGGLNRRAGVH